MSKTEYVEADEPTMPNVAKMWIPTGGELRVIRDALGLTRKEVQEKTGIKPRTLGNWEAEDTYPRANDLRRLLALYRVEARDELR